jgi:hypothetical protein
MSELTDQHLPPEPHDGIDAAANPEAQAQEADQTPALARAGAGDGPPPVDAPPAGEMPDVEGTGAGDALAGVHISEQDAEGAVPGDEGPEHPGVRRST